MGTSSTNISLKHLLCYYVKGMVGHEGQLLRSRVISRSIDIEFSNVHSLTNMNMGSREQFTNIYVFCNHFSVLNIELRHQSSTKRVLLFHPIPMHITFSSGENELAGPNSSKPRKRVFSMTFRLLYRSIH